MQWSKYVTSSSSVRTELILNSIFLDSNKIRLSKSSSLLWDVVWWTLVISYRRFGTTYWSYLPRVKHSATIVWPLKMGQIICPKTSITNHQPTPWNISEDRRPQLHRSGSLKSRKIVQVFRLSQQCNLAEDSVPLGYDVAAVDNRIQTKMRTLRHPETSGSDYPLTHRHIPDRTLQNKIVLKRAYSNENGTTTEKWRYVIAPGALSVKSFKKQVSLL